MPSIPAAVVAVALLFSMTALADDSVPVGRLPRTVVPSHVSLELKIDPALSRFSGHVAIEVDVAEATRTIWMHGRDLQITRATFMPANGANFELQVAAVDVSGVLKLTAPTPLPTGRAVLVFDYSAPFGELQGAYKVKPDGHDYVVTQMEPLGARNTFPSFDEPSFKQPWDISIEAPDSQKVVANTRELRSEPAGAGWTRHVFATTENLPSYLIAFAVGPWDIVDGPDMPANAVRNYPVKLRGIAAQGQGARMNYALANTAAIVAAEEQYFGIAYPFDKLDLVAAPDFWAGAMENAGLIVYRDSIMFANEQSQVRTRQGYWVTHAHELAHQWFGDLVTMPWWDDVWLNEAFATWMEAKVVGQLQPGFHSDRSLMEGALGAMGEDSLASTRRVHEPINEFTDVQSAFDGITYQKGGGVLAMFERYVGEDKFRAAIRSYLGQHSRGNATSADLIDAIAAASNEPDGVRHAFNDFINQPGVPIVHVAAKCAAGKKPSLLVEQERFLPVGSSAPASGEWLLPLCVRYGDATGLHEQCGLVGGRQATVELQTESCPSFVMPNADGAGYYRFAMSPSDQARLEANFDRLNEREQRAFADSISAAYEAGAIDTKAFLSAALRLANAQVRQTALAPLGNIGWMIENLARNEAEKQSLRDFVAQAYGPRLASMGTQPKPGESDDDRLLRNSLINTLASTAKEPKLRAVLAAQGRAVLGLGGDGGLHLDAAATDQRGLALRVAMEDGAADVFEALLKQLAVSQDAVLRGQLLGALSSAKVPELIARVRAMAFEPGKLRRNELYSAVFAGDDTEASHRATSEWLDAHFSEIVAKLAPAGASLVSGFSIGMCSIEAADTLTPKLTERMSTIEGGPRALAQTVEEVKLCAALKARQSQGGMTLPPTGKAAH
jgi:alanyl aminopeptidase